MKSKWIIGLMAVAPFFIACGGEKGEEGTENKDTVAEKKDTVPAYEYTYEVTETEVAPSWWIYVGDSTTLADLEATFEKSSKVLMDYWKKNKLAEAPMMAAYDNFSETEKFYVRIGVPVTDSTLKVKGNMKLEKGYSGKAIKTTLNGSYDGMKAAWGDLIHYTEEKGLEMNGSGWEVYIKGPGNETDSTKYVTDIYVPVK